MGGKQIDSLCGVTLLTCIGTLDSDLRKHTRVRMASWVLQLQRCAGWLLHWLACLPPRLPAHPPARLHTHASPPACLPPACLQVAAGATPYLFGGPARPACTNCNRTTELWSNFCQFKSSGPVCPLWVRRPILAAWAQRGWELPLTLTPCDLWEHLAGRTLWLMAGRGRGGEGEREKARGRGRGRARTREGHSLRTEGLCVSWRVAASQPTPVRRPPPPSGGPPRTHTHPPTHHHRHRHTP